MMPFLIIYVFHVLLVTLPFLLQTTFDSATGRKENRQSHRQAESEAIRWKDGQLQTDRQTVRQTDMSVCLSNYLSGCLSESRDRQREGLMCLPKPPVH